MEKVVINPENYNEYVVYSKKSMLLLKEIYNALIHLNFKINNEEEITTTQKLLIYDLFIKLKMLEVKTNIIKDLCRVIDKYSDDIFKDELISYVCIISIGKSLGDNAETATKQKMLNIDIFAESRECLKISEI